MSDEDEDTLPNPDAPDTHEDHKSRKHGYRGYPNNPKVGGGVHSGSGFAGVGSTADGGTGVGGASILGEKTRESVDEMVEEEKEKGE